MNSPKWKTADKLCDSTYETVLKQAKANIGTAMEAAAFVLIWVFPMMGSVSKEPTRLNTILKTLSALCILVATTIMLMQINPYIKIKRKDFEWLYTTVGYKQNHLIVCENGIECNDFIGAADAYNVGNKIVVLQVAGKIIAFSNRKSKKTKKSKNS